MNAIEKIKLVGSAVMSMALYFGLMAMPLI